MKDAKDQKDPKEQKVKAQTIKLDDDFEELERRIAPRLSANHNETMLRDYAE